MKRRYYIPARLHWRTEPTAEENARLQRVITDAIRRAVESSAGEEIVVADFDSGMVARDRFSPTRYRPEHGAYAVRSYQDAGELAEVPMEEITFEEAPVITGVRDQVIEEKPPFEGSLALALPGNHYVHVNSHRYAISGNVASAYDWGRALFGATAWVIAAGSGRQGGVVYYVAALDEALTEADLRVESTASSQIPGETGRFGGHVLPRMPGGYDVVAVGFHGGGFSAPGAEAFVGFQLQVREARQMGAASLPPELVRASVFGPIDELLARGGDGDLERAAELLAELNATAFAVLDWETKARYLQALIQAWTSEPQEVAIVEILKSVGSRSELFAALGLVRQAGLYDQLFADLDGQIWSLLITVGERFGDPEPMTFEFLVELSQQAGLVPRTLEEVAARIVLGPLGPVLSSNMLAELEEAARGFVRFLGGAIEGIWMIISHPEKLVEGISALIKLAVMVQLAQLGYAPAVTYVTSLLQNMARQVMHGLKGARLLGVSEEIVRRIKWAILWEVASWFVGIGEVKAILSGVGLTERLAAVARLLRAIGLFGRVAEEGRIASKLEHLARLMSRISVISHEDDVLRLLSHLPEEDLARLGRAIEAADVHAVQNMAELSARHPELAEAAQRALGRAEALAQLEVRTGRLTDNLVEGFQRLARRSGFNNRELLDLMAAIPAEHAELFMRAVRAMPESALSGGIGARSLGFFQGLATRPRSMRFLVEANYDTFSALYRHTNYNIARFEETLDGLEDLARRLPAGQREVEYRRLLDRLRSNDQAALGELREAINRRRAARGLPALRSYTAAELDEIVRTTPDIRQIRQLAAQMDNSTAGSLFERWVNRYVFHQPVGSPRARLSVRRGDNMHLGLQRDRSSDFFLEGDGSVWDSKIYQSAGEVDAFQLDDYRRMEEAGFVFTADGQRRSVASINYLFSDRAAAEANRAFLHVGGGAEAWYIDDHGVLRHLD